MSDATAPATAPTGADLAATIIGTITWLHAEAALRGHHFPAPPAAPPGSTTWCLYQGTLGQDAVRNSERVRGRIAHRLGLLANAAYLCAHVEDNELCPDRRARLVARFEESAAALGGILARIAVPE